MTGKALLDNATLILGFKSNDDLLKVGIRYINQVCADLSMLTKVNYKPINSLSESLSLSNDMLDNIAVYGVAMHLALYRGDGEGMQLYSSIFNQKRRLLSTTTERVDLLPRGED